MPLLLGLFLVATFIWIAENAGTFSRAWAYPHQAAAWAPVTFAKLGAWFLLMLISYVLVAAVQGVRQYCTVPSEPEDLPLIESKSLLLPIGEGTQE
jgi:uncharacterized membrane protein YoaT (DUF817 family)